MFTSLALGGWTTLVSCPSDRLSLRWSLTLNVLNRNYYVYRCSLGGSATPICKYRHIVILLLLPWFAFW